MFTLEDEHPALGPFTLIDDALLQVYDWETSFFFGYDCRVSFPCSLHARGKDDLGPIVSLLEKIDSAQGQIVDYLYEQFRDDAVILAWGMSPEDWLANLLPFSDIYFQSQDEAILSFEPPQDPTSSVIPRSLDVIVRADGTVDVAYFHEGWDKQFTASTLIFGHDSTERS